MSLQAALNTGMGTWMCMWTELSDQYPTVSVNWLRHFSPYYGMHKTLSLHTSNLN